MSEWLTLVNLVLKDTLISAISMMSAVLIIVIAIRHLLTLTRSSE